MDSRSILKRYEVELDLKRASSTGGFEVVDGDTGNLIVVNLTDNGLPVLLTGQRVLAVFSNSNGTFMQDSSDANGGITIADNEVIIELFPESVAPGIVECELQIYTGLNDELGIAPMYPTLITSAKFNFSCRKSIFNATTMQTIREFPMLMQLIELVLEAESQRTDSETGRVSAEGIRASNEAQRVTSENSRVLAENARSSAETARVSAENSRVTAENARNSSETARVSAENARVTAENARVSAENSRATSESGRNFAETTRVTAENGRVTAENARVSAENSRATSESGRNFAETTRVTAENGRVSAENTRISAEDARASAEDARASAEDARAEEELARQSAEIARNLAEAMRSSIIRGSVAPDVSPLVGNNAVDSTYLAGWYSYDGGLLLVDSGLTSVSANPTGSVRQLHINVFGAIRYRTGTFKANAQISWNDWANKLLEKEDVSNKVTALSESSTHAQYPSAKCVYDLIKSTNARIDAIIGGSSSGRV